MKQNTLSKFFLAVSAGALVAFSVKGEEVDLKGVVVSAADGKGLGGAVVTLMDARASDTTEISGIFRITRKESAVRRQTGQKGLLHAAADRGTIELFDMAGRLLQPTRSVENGIVNLSRQKGGTMSLVFVRIRRNNDDLLYKGITTGCLVKKGSATDPDRSTFAKITAFVDTLSIAKPGYRTMKVPVPGYMATIDTIRLQMQTDSFTIRKPSERTLSCAGMAGATTVKAWDVDMLCECQNDSMHATVYVQTHPVSCGAMSAINYAVDNAWIKTSEGISLLTRAVYDGGGNHHNDRVTFEWKGRFYSFYHSSFGFGWRSCSPTDCMQICSDTACRSVLFDGCARSACTVKPSLRIRCVAVNNNGSVPVWLDEWTAHAGVDYYPRLPCPGDPICK